ncbi:AbrB family transcriptional regulator (plasmid) [Thioclava sp. 'Guangxiensis']|uniref:AbrB family transcriptional regulator n=1 Tax=Thioclava sp. 'Guangxiensis' TaxID=3149044 RepID=UPI003877B6F6
MTELPLSMPRRATGLVWILLIGLSFCIAALLEALRIPAALLLGPMIAGILLAATGVAAGTRAISVPRWGFELAQAMVGTMIAGQIPADILQTIAADWPIFLGGIVSVIAASSALGYLLALKQVLPGNTAIWGASPGAAQAVIFLAEAYGADIRLVAVMQYLRVGMVAGGASIVARLVHADPDAVLSHPAWFPMPDMAFLQALIVMALGVGLARLTRMNAGTFLLPLLIGSIASGVGWMTPELPQWSLALAYAVIGWMIGLRFSRDILRHAARALPRLMLSIALLMSLCGMLAAGLVLFAGVDPLTAYLATSPGGADSIAIIAASSHVDMAFVMGMQTLRFIVVLATGPAIARFMAVRLAQRQAAKAA